MAESTPPHARFALGAPVVAAPVIDASGRLTLGAGSQVLTLDPLTEAVVWQVDAPGRIEAALALTPDGTRLVPCTDGTLLALGPDGTEAWRYQLEQERPTISPTGARALRGGVALGPDGLIVVGGDDFHVYGFDRGGRLRWATPTGLPVRARAAIGPDGAVFVGGLDRHVIRLDPGTGAIRWRRSVGNAVAGSPVLSGDGLVVVGTLGGVVHGMSTADGVVRFTRTLGGPIVAGPCRLAGGWGVVTTDGRVFGLDRDGHVRWERTLDASVHAAPVAGIGPEGREVWCLATSAGHVQALWALDGEPAGRWDVADAPLTGIAMVPGGAVATSAGGAVVQGPWDAFVPEDPAVDVEGLVLGDGPSVRAAAGAVVSLRMTRREGGRTVGAVVETPVRSTSAWAHTLRTSAEGTQLHLVPTDPTPGPHEVAISVAYRASGARHEAEANVAVDIDAPQGEAPRAFRLERPIVDDPSLVGALDPAGLAGLALDVAVLEEDASGRGVAWGYVRETGGPDPARFAFRTQRSGGALVLESGPCRVPLAGTHVVLQRMRLSISGTHPEGSLLVEASGIPASPTRLNWLLDHPKAAIERSGKPFLAARGVWARLARQLPPRPRLEQLRRLGEGAGRTLAALPGLLDAQVWGPWGLFDAGRRFLGVGRFRVAEVPEADRPPPEVDHVRADATRRLVRATVTGDLEARNGIVGIVLVDLDTMAPLTLDYTARTSILKHRDGSAAEIVLEIPLDTNLARPVEAWVVGDLGILWRGPLTARGGRPAGAAPDAPQPPADSTDDPSSAGGPTEAS